MNMSNGLGSQNQQEQPFTAQTASQASMQINDAVNAKMKQNNPGNNVSDGGTTGIQPQPEQTMPAHDMQSIADQLGQVQQYAQQTGNQRLFEMTKQVASPEDALNLIEQVRGSMQQDAVQADPRSMAGGLAPGQNEPIYDGRQAGVPIGGPQSDVQGQNNGVPPEVQQMIADGATPEQAAQAYANQMQRAASMAPGLGG